MQAGRWIGCSREVIFSNFDDFWKGVLVVISDGIGLMLAGMTVVFCVLTLLVVSMQLSSLFFKRFARYFPEEQSPLESVSVEDGDLVHIAVALAALTAHRK